MDNLDCNFSLLWLQSSTWCCHQKEKFSAWLAFGEGNPPANGGFPSQGPVTRALMLSLMCAWTNGDLRCNDAHCDVTEMKRLLVYWSFDKLGTVGELKNFQWVRGMVCNCLYPCTDSRDRTIMMPNLLPLVHVVAMANCGATRDAQIGIMTTPWQYYIPNTVTLHERSNVST